MRLMSLLVFSFPHKIQNLLLFMSHLLRIRYVISGKGQRFVLIMVLLDIDVCR